MYTTRRRAPRATLPALVRRPQYTRGSRGARPGDLRDPARARAPGRLAPSVPRVATILGLALTLGACDTRRAREQPPRTRAPDDARDVTAPPTTSAYGPVGTLVGARVELTRAPNDERSCWLERPCDPAAQCHWGPLPCGPAGCQEMRRWSSCEPAGSGSCRERESCVVEPAPPHEPDKAPYGQCRATACELDSDCRSANLSCVRGVCEHRSCASSRECDGYCVHGVCAVTAGECYDPGRLRVP